MEITTKYVEIVNSLDDAWTFVLRQTAGLPFSVTDGHAAVPRIQISPFWDYGDDVSVLKFEACVSIHQRLPEQ